MRYRRGFEVEEVIHAAQSELPREQLKIFLLAIMAGLRRNEIDKLEWKAFRWNEGVIRIEATRHFQPKSEDSTGDVDVDTELLEIFRGFFAHTKGSFVIESSNAPRVGATYPHYRCQKEFEKLTAWLRTKVWRRTHRFTRCGKSTVAKYAQSMASTLQVTLCVMRTLHLRASITSTESRGQRWISGTCSRAGWIQRM